MKRNIFFILLILIMAVSICVSCKSTPDTPAPQPRPAPAAPAAGKAVADQARQRAMDFEAPAYFPSEWAEAEAQYESAADAAAYNSVAAVYDDLFKKSIPLYAQAREDEIMASREHLIASGFANAFPQYLKKADELALAAFEQYEAEDYYKARDTASEALAEYEALNLGAKIFVARQEILDRGFAQYDPDNFVRADEVAQAAITAFDAGDKQTASANGEEAMLRYNLVLANGWIAYASDRKASASAERELAMSERANIASRETFRGADAFYNQAEENYTAENFRDAGLGYIEAEARFAISRKETEEKRLIAEEAIRIAEEKIEESSETAVEAERIIEGGVR